MDKPRRSSPGSVERSSNSDRSNAGAFLLEITNHTNARPEIGTNIVAAALQQHLASIVEFSDDAIISKDLHGVIQTWNRGAQRIFGYTPDEVIGQHISVLAAPGRLEDFSNILERISSGERIEHYHTKRRAKDGRILSISLSVSPIRDATGTIVGASKIARDITYEKRYSELQEHLASIVEFSDDAIISKDLNGIIQSWNRGAQRIFGYTPGEIIGQHVSILAAPDRLDELPHILRRISCGEHVEHYKTRRKAKDGRILSVSLTVSPIRDATGTIVGASKIVRDITEEEKSQRALTHANEALTRSNADLEQFAYSASHDLQEPLRMVSAYGEMLQRKFGSKLGEQADQYIGFIVEGATRMERLLRDLRVFTQASRLGEPAIGTVDANEVLAESLANLNATIQESEALLTYTPLPSVRVHKFQLEQLFQNLVGNAIRYRSEKRPEIHISAESHGSMWQFSVRDNGLGIDSAYKEQIFGLFKRLHSVADYPGTGMGLAICQRIMERVGGRIWVESNLGQGSTFLFTLPAA